MASKLDEMRAFSKLNKAFPKQYCTLDLEIKRYANDPTVKMKYHAYAAPIGKTNFLSQEYDTPMPAVEEVINHYFGDKR